MMTDASPTLLWFTRDLRLRDLPALAAALADGGPVAPVFVAETDEAGRLTDVEGAGAASQWRMGRSLEALSADIAARGGSLILRRGRAAEELADLAQALGATQVRASRSWHPGAARRAEAVRRALAQVGVNLSLHDGRLLTDPAAVQTQTGGFFKVYTPFWKATAPQIAAADAGPAPARWPAPTARPASLTLEELALDAAVRRGGAVLAEHATVGEAAAQARLSAFVAEDIAGYHLKRDRLDLAATSGLSAHLACGEISPGDAWRAARAVAQARPETAAGADMFRKELVWREFAWHLLHHTPHIETRNWRPEWDAFGWDGESALAERWRRGQTGVDVVDAAMRELYVTGVMHNRARMLTASYLTKHLLTHWRLGAAWFADCLVDFDPASNAMGWQWSAGSGPDAAPFFRVFNPDTQAEKFDPAGRYRARWLPDRAADIDLFGAPRAAGEAPGWRFFDAAPRAWALRRDGVRPEPAIDLKAGRVRALAAHKALTSHKPAVRA